MTRPWWKDKFHAAAARPEPSTADEFCRKMKTVSGKTERRRRSFGQTNRENTEKRHAGEEVICMAFLCLWHRKVRAVSIISGKGKALDSGYGSGEEGAV